MGHHGLIPVADVRLVAQEVLRQRVQTAINACQLIVITEEGQQVVGDEAVEGVASYLSLNLKSYLEIYVYTMI